MYDHRYEGIYRPQHHMSFEVYQGIRTQISKQETEPLVSETVPQPSKFYRALIIILKIIAK